MTLRIVSTGRLVSPGACSSLPNHTPKVKIFLAYLNPSLAGIPPNQDYAINGGAGRAALVAGGTAQQSFHSCHISPSDND
jgi:hypothetical protein